MSLHVRTEPILYPPCSFVVPCLNEERTIASVLSRIEDLRPFFQDMEILVVDNGSGDGSRDLVRAGGRARLLECADRGYGAALRRGIDNAAFDIVISLDADDSYDPAEALRLLGVLLETGSQLVVGNRLHGEIEDGAMPALHRWVGTPGLSFLITLIFGWHRRVRVADCNGGLRVYYKSAFQVWNARSPGMEFASEMIIRALQNGAGYREVPIRYRRSVEGRRPHLRTWRDGLRHLREILRLAAGSFSHRSGRKRGAVPNDQGTGPRTEIR